MNQRNELWIYAKSLAIIKTRKEENENRKRIERWSAKWQQRKKQHIEVAYSKK